MIVRDYLIFDCDITDNIHYDYYIIGYWLNVDNAYGKLRE